MDSIGLIVGLGNPGPDYENTRHNYGFLLVDALLRQAEGRKSSHLEVLQQGGEFQLWRLNLGGSSCLVAKPLTYMNLSGKSVAALARFFKIAPDEILAIHDELDLPPGEMKFKKGGGNGGHNGLKDMQAQLGSGDFWRLRLGIGHPGHKAEVAGYVLRKPPLAERQAVEDCIEKSYAAVELMLRGEMDKALAKIHAKPPRPKPPKPQPPVDTQNP